MGEEVKDTEIKIWQIRFAKTIRVSEDALRVMEEMNDDLKRMWLLVCAMDGMEVSEEEARSTLPEIQEKRNAYLKEKHNAAMSEIEREVEKLKREVRRELQESKAVRSSVEGGIETALKEQAAAQKRLVEAKDEVISMLRHQVEELERRKTGYQIEADDQGAAVPGKEESRVQEEEKRDAPEGTRGRMPRVIAYFRKSRKTAKFIENYLKDEKMSEEQREFFLSCMEEGMSIRDIEAIASPHLSIEIMTRLKDYRKENG